MGGSVVDIVATQGPVLWAIETKISLSLVVLGQAHRWRGFAHLVSCGVAPGRRSVGRDFAIEQESLTSSTNDKRFVRVEIQRGPKRPPPQSSPPTRSLTVARARQAMKRRSRRAARMTLAVVVLGLGVIGVATTVMFMRIAVTSSQPVPKSVYDSTPTLATGTPMAGPSMANVLHATEDTSPANHPTPAVTITSLDSAGVPSDSAGNTR